MIVDKAGDIFDDDAPLLVIPVNCVGVMTDGLALAARKRWTSLYGRYKEDCKRGIFNPGSLRVYDVSPDRRVGCLATNLAWEDRPRFEWVQWCLANLSRHCVREQVPAVAVPALGCGENGLSWPAVREAVCREFENFPGIEVRLYRPHK